MLIIDNHITFKKIGFNLVYKIFVETVGDAVAIAGAPTHVGMTLTIASFDSIARFLSVFLHVNYIYEIL